MFKECFKKYKLKTATYDEIIDFSQDNTVDRAHFTKSNVYDDKIKNIWCLKPVSQWELYTSKSISGLIFIKNPFTALGQRYWSIRCLKYYTAKPNKSNLDVHYPNISNGEVWSNVETKNDFFLLNRLRWVTLGYHHNWDTKVYSEESRNDFPSDLKVLSEHVPAILGFKSFKAEAAIVNFYHMDSTLSGHTDHSEKNLEAPLLSFSFGQSAIFLIGGKTLQENPIGMFLKSGDIVVMSGESRLCYHGVPKILKNNENAWVENEEEYVEENDVFDRDVIEYSTQSDYWKSFRDYLCNNRININVRQVLKDGEINL